MNLDGFVDDLDLSALAAAISAGDPGSRFDINGDEALNLDDYAALGTELAMRRAMTELSHQAPEPTGLIHLVLGAVFGLRRRGRIHRA